MASVRFICGAQTLHRELERAIARHLGKDDAIVFAACFDANGGVFEPLMGEEDAIISDSLNHASIIDGVRLAKAKRYRFANSDMNALEDRLKQAEADGARFKLIATDGVFSMDGYVANLPEICALAERYGAMVLVDDCHATGHLGEKGRGTPALTGAGDRVDIVTGTFGKTLGGGMGGFVAAAQPIVDLLRQRARPYLFSNSLAPPVAAGALKALEIAIRSDDRRALLQSHARRFRAGLEAAGFKTLPGVTPIIPVMLGEARVAQDLARALDRARRLCRRLLLPGRTEGAGAHSHPDVGRADGRGRRCGVGGVQGRRQGAGICIEGPDMMKALVKAKPQPGLWLEDQPVPAIGPEDVLVKIYKTGICGTDLHIYNWDEWAQKTIPTPMTIGHEYAGEIAEVGANVKRLTVGQRVSGEGHVIGMRSRAARGGRYHLDPETQGIGVNIPGAFADYVRVPAFNIVPLPDAVDDELGAILDPLGNAVHTALTYDLVGEDVLITGAGPIGIMAGAVARHVGARHVVITDISPKRLALAAEVADIMPVDVSTDDLKAVMARLKMTEGFDVALEMSGAPAAFDQLFDSIVTGGRVALLGLPARPTLVDWNKVIFKQLTLKGVYGREMFETWHKMIAMLESGLAVRKVITHRLPAVEFLQGFEIMRRGDSGKIVLDWT